MAVCTRLLGWGPGIIAGKVLADVVFYLPVIGSTSTGAASDMTQNGHPTRVARKFIRTVMAPHTANGQGGNSPNTVIFSCSRVGSVKNAELILSGLGVSSCEIDCDIPSKPGS